MADQPTTISGLDPAQLPLAGPEQIPMDQQGDTVRVSAQEIANLAPGTDLSYDPVTRTLGSSTGGDVEIPEASAAYSGLLPASWITGASPASFPHIDGNLNGIVYQNVRNASGAPMPALTPYHAIGNQGDTDRVLIVPARADDPTTMPASGILPLGLAASGSAADGLGAVAGVLAGVSSAPLGASGAVLYVAMAGGMTSTRPAANAQAVAVVGRSHATTGSVIPLLGPSLAGVAYSGNYGDLLGLPTLGTAAAANVSDFAPAAALATKADLVNGLVPSAQLPGFVDDVLEFADLAAFPATGETGKLYISLASNRQYRWSGSQYTEISPSPGSTDSVPEGSVNLYYTLARAQQAISAWWTGVSTAAGRALVTAVDTAAQRTALGLGDAAQGALSDAAPAALVATASAGTSANVSRADHRHQLQSEYCVIPLSGASQAVAQGLLDTNPRWHRSETLLELPLWAVRDAPTGANMVLDMRINGVSIFSTLPSIDATEQGSETAAVPGVFSAAFIASGYLIPQYSVVSWWAVQVGTGGGVGLKVSVLTRGA